LKKDTNEKRNDLKLCEMKKEEQHEQAKELYFQTNLSKAAIADKVGVTRKTVLFWSQQGNWERIRLSARNMPSLVAEKCYYLIDHYVNSLLTDGNATGMSTLQLRHAQTVHLFATSIKKLKNRSTTNESMEMFNFFMDGLNRRDPVLAEQVKPEIEKYITIRENCDTRDYLMEEFLHDGTLPWSDLELQEKWADEKDNAELKKDFETFLSNRPGNDPSSPNPVTPVPPSGGHPINRETNPHINEAA
jgi:DNA-binding XRE family transcriptional regulator